MGRSGDKAQGAFPRVWYSLWKQGLARAIQQAPDSAPNAAWNINYDGVQTHEHEDGGGVPARELGTFQGALYHLLPLRGGDPQLGGGYQHRVGAAQGELFGKASR